jgi:hypothetical protein
VSRLGARSAPSHTVSREAGVPVEQLFDVVVAEDVLPKVLHRYGPVPGVRGTRDLTAPWTAPGAQRTVLLDDGTTAVERLEVFERPHRFEYRVDSFSGVLRRLVDHGAGRWTFASTPAGSRFDWTYTFVPRRAWIGPALSGFVRLGWAGYMARCADRCVALAGGMQP